MIYDMKTKSFKHIIGYVIIYTVFICASIAVIAPFWWMISTSFDRAAITRLPFPPRFWPQTPSTWGYFVALKNVPMLRYYTNTTTVAAGTIIISLFSATLAAYSFSKLRFRGYKICMMFVVCVLMMPTEVVMIPQYFLFASLNLTDTYYALWLPGLCYVFGTFLMKQYMDTIPSAIRESAMIDGAGELYIFYRIYLPLCSAIIATICIMLFLYSWNDLLWPLLILRTNARHTMQIGLESMRASIQIQPASQMAATLLSILPVLTVYMILQRYIVASISMSGVKQ